MAKDYDYRDDLADLQAAIGDLAADLEDIRDDAQDLFDENGDTAIQADVARLDGVIALLAQAMDLMDSE